ncbi:MAG: peptidoglycan-associated lipoprotein Pal [Acidobacteria bacterium]|nr:peptidoglycan-associated lipoprotein Pal [Acidobacteriota bacterium]
MRRLGPYAAALLAVAVSVGACAKKKPEPAPAPPPAAAVPPTTPVAPPPPPAPPPAPGPAAPTEDEIFNSKSLDQLNAEKPLAVVYFALDSTELTPEARAILQKNFEWMKRWPSTKVLAEGHADSRGTNEYNLALGERRADAVRDYLTGLGVATDRITVVSKGEEQPTCTEETESCWQRNRRGQFIITAK